LATVTVGYKPDSLLNYGYRFGSDSWAADHGFAYSQECPIPTPPAGKVYQVTKIGGSFYKEASAGDETVRLGLYAGAQLSGATLLCEEELDLSSLSGDSRGFIEVTLSTPVLVSASGYFYLISKSANEVGFDRNTSHRQECALATTCAGTPAGTCTVTGEAKYVDNTESLSDNNDGSVPFADPFNNYVSSLASGIIVALWAVLEDVTAYNVTGSVDLPALVGTGAGSYTKPTWGDSVYAGLYTSPYIYFGSGIATSRTGKAIVLAAPMPAITDSRRWYLSGAGVAASSFSEERLFRIGVYGADELVPPANIHATRHELFFEQIHDGVSQGNIVYEPDDYIEIPFWVRYLYIIVKYVENNGGVPGLGIKGGYGICVDNNFQPIADCTTLYISTVNGYDDFAAEVAFPAQLEDTYFLAPETNSTNNAYIFAAKLTQYLLQTVYPATGTADLPGMPVTEGDLDYTKGYFFGITMDSDDVPDHNYWFGSVITEPYYNVFAVILSSSLFIQPFTISGVSANSAGKLRYVKIGLVPNDTLRHPFRLALYKLPEAGVYTGAELLFEQELRTDPNYTQYWPTDPYIDGVYTYDVVSLQFYVGSEMYVFTPDVPVFVDNGDELAVVIKSGHLGYDINGIVAEPTPTSSLVFRTGCLYRPPTLDPELVPCPFSDCTFLKRQHPSILCAFPSGPYEVVEYAEGTPAANGEVPYSATWDYGEPTGTGTPVGEVPGPQFLLAGLFLESVSDTVTVEADFVLPPILAEMDASATLPAIAMETNNNIYISRDSRTEPITSWCLDRKLGREFGKC